MSKTALTKPAGLRPIHSKKTDYSTWIRELENLHRSKLIDPPLFDIIVSEQLKRSYGVEHSVTNASMLFLFDNSTVTYKFVSSTAEQVLGYNSEEIVRNGFNWLLSLLPANEMGYKKEVMADIFGFVAGLPPEQVRELTVRYDIVALTKSGTYKYFLEELMFPVVSEKGMPILVTCFIHTPAVIPSLDTRKCVISDPRKPKDKRILFEKTYALDDQQNLASAHP